MFWTQPSSCHQPAQRRCLFFQLNCRLYLYFTIFSTAILYLLHCQGQPGHGVAHLRGRYARQGKGYENNLTWKPTPEMAGWNLQT